MKSGQSAAEYALLRISQEPPCSDIDLDFQAPGDLDYFDINITIKYVYTNANSICSTNGGEDWFDIQTDDQNGSVLMDITVSVDDTTITTEPIRYFRRSIQKL